MKLKRWSIQWTYVYPHGPDYTKTWHDTRLRFWTKKGAERARTELVYSVPMKDKTKLHRIIKL